MNKDNLIEFAKDQCEIFPEDSFMGEYLRETMKMLQESPCEDVPDTNVGNKADGMTKEPTAYRRYRDLLEYFGDDSILEDDEEFKKWLKRIKWHVRKANELYRKYECQKEPCEDAVSRKKLEKLKRWRFSYDTNTTIPKSDLFVKLTDIRALPSVIPTQKWIPVSERLPEPNIAVLIYVSTGASKTFCLAYWNGVCGGWEEWIGTRMIETEMEYKVLAWMPLPEPYKESEEE